MWRLKVCSPGFSQDRGYLDNSDKDVCFKQLISAVSKIVGVKFKAIVFPNVQEKSLLVVVDDESLIELLGKYDCVDVTLGGSLEWFVPFLGYSESFSWIEYYAFDKETGILLGQELVPLSIKEGVYNGLSSVVNNRFMTGKMPLRFVINGESRLVTVNEVCNKNKCLKRKVVKEMLHMWQYSRECARVRDGNSYKYRIRFMHCGKEQEALLIEVYSDGRITCKKVN